TPEEALQLRDLCEPDRLLVMGGLGPTSCADAAAVGCAVICSNDEMVDVLESAVPPGARLPVHLKIDTGMGRLGCPPAEAPGMALDAVRPGLAMYGFVGDGLRPALRLRAMVTRVADVARGESVGYGRAWVAPRASRVATVAIGYEDGVKWSRANRGSVVVGGR